MKYMLINPTFVDYPVQITNKEAIYCIEEQIKETLNTDIGVAFLIRVEKMIYKLILEEKSKDCFKFRLTSNIYV